MITLRQTEVKAKTWWTRCTGCHLFFDVVVCCRRFVTTMVL